MSGKRTEHVDQVDDVTEQPAEQPAYVEPAAEGWVDLVHPETGGTTSVPDAPGVVEAHEGRGWTRSDQATTDTGPALAVPASTDPDDLKE